jgi:hypothetical protein
MNSVAIESVVETIVDSAVFRSSKQCQLLLRYIVEHSIAGEDELLRERVIGAALFHRAPAYDAANDPIVRARVGEVRKRLAQFYQEFGHEAEVLISIPSGSYRAVFSFRERNAGFPAATDPVPEHQLIDRLTVAIPPHSSPPALAASTHLDSVESSSQTSSESRENSLRIAIAICAIMLMTLAGWLWKRSRSVDKDQQIFAKFWAPLVVPAKPTVIYIGGNYTYRLSPSFLQEYQARQHKPYNGPEFFIDLKDGESIPEKEIIPTHSFIGFGDVAASSRIVSTLTRLNAKYDLRYGEDIAVTDMRTSPLILIGGFSNAWAMQLTGNLRFALQGGDRIIDHQNPNRAWPNLSGTADNPPSDYAVVSRLAQSPTGGFTLIVAGVGTVGNQAAADFISDPVALAKLLKGAPQGWERMNMQAVLRTTEMKDIPVSTEVKAVYFW